jgi:hypothetical protein
VLRSTTWSDRVFYEGSRGHDRHPFRELCWLFREIRRGDIEAAYTTMDRALLIEKLKLTIRKLQHVGLAYVRDDRPFAGPGPPAAVFFYSRESWRRAA